MIRLVGVLFIVTVLYLLMLASDAGARTWAYQQQLAGWVGFYGIITVGVGILILAGGIDLSIGSVVGLGAVCYGLLLSGELAVSVVAAPVLLTLIGVITFGVGLLLGHFVLPTTADLLARAATLATLVVPLGFVALALVSWLTVIQVSMAPLITPAATLLVVSGGVTAALRKRGTSPREALGYIIGGLVGLVFAILMLSTTATPLVAAAWIVAAAATIGLCHGLLVTQLRLQPFLVTLCGLFIYRGLAKSATSATVGRGASDALRELLVGGYGEGGRNQLAVLLVVAALLALFLHGTRYGRYLFAIGANEDAARYAGIATDRYKILAYVICSGMAGLAAVLFLLQNDSANPTSAGSWLELYAITGAVLGGCSLRGGEGMIPGMVLGAAVLPLLRALCAFNRVGSEVEYAVIGLALLLGTIADELLKRRAARRPS